MDGAIDERDIIISVLRDQRNALLDQVTSLQIEILKMKPFMPKEPTNDDIGGSSV